MQNWYIIFTDIVLKGAPTSGDFTYCEEIHTAFFINDWKVTCHFTAY